MKIIKPEMRRPELMGQEVTLVRFATDPEEGFDPFGDDIPCAVVTLVSTGEEVFVWMDEIDVLAPLPYTSKFALAAQSWLEWASQGDSGKPDPALVEAHLKQVGVAAAGNSDSAVAAVLLPIPSSARGSAAYHHPPRHV